MNECIYDMYQQCMNSCSDCRKYLPQCCKCGVSCDNEKLYDNYGDIYCLNCLIDEQGSELYSDFVFDNEDLFKDYCMKTWEENRLLCS